MNLQCEADPLVCTENVTDIKLVTSRYVSNLNTAATPSTGVCFLNKLNTNVMLTCIHYTFTASSLHSKRSKLKKIGRNFENEKQGLNNIHCLMHPFFFQQKGEKGETGHACIWTSKYIGFRVLYRIYCWGAEHQRECQIIAKYTTLKDDTCNVSQS